MTDWGVDVLKLDQILLRQDDFSLTADFALEAGARLALIGPSGAGKSTLLNLIAGFLTVTSGRVLWQGQDITTLPAGRRPVSILFQDNNLFPHLSVEQNVGLGIHPNLKLSRQDRARVDAALKRVGLAGYEGRRPATLSGGQQSRAALARVLVQDRPLVLLDEPFAALGPALRSEMLGLVQELLEDSGATLIMVSHQPEDAQRIATHVSVVAENRVTAPKATDALFADPPQVLRDYLG